MSIAFTPEQLRLLAKAERDMDDGSLPFVWNRGQRFAVASEAMAHFDLRSGQTVSDVLVVAILQWTIAQLESEPERCEEESRRKPN